MPSSQSLEISPGPSRNPDPLSSWVPGRTPGRPSAHPIVTPQTSSWQVVPSASGNSDASSNDASSSVIVLATVPGSMSRRSQGTSPDSASNASDRTSQSCDPVRGAAGHLHGHRPVSWEQVQDRRRSGAGSTISKTPGTSEFPEALPWNRLKLQAPSGVESHRGQPPQSEAHPGATQGAFSQQTIGPAPPPSLIRPASAHLGGARSGAACQIPSPNWNPVQSYDSETGRGAVW